MYQHAEEHTVNAPLLTKLIDHEPGNTKEAQTLNHISIDELYDDLRLNLEHLLNTRVKITPAAQLPSTLQQSCIQYGIPDFSGYNFVSEKNHQALCQTIKHAIETFEPRLTHVNVILVDRDEIEIKRALTFRIEATIHLAQKRQLTSFESSLDIVNKNFRFESL